MPILTRVIPAPGTSSGSGSGSRVYGEVPTGAINGVNTVFTTNVEFVSGSDAVYLNGLRQREGALFDYVRSESGGIGTGYDTVTFTLAPKTGDTVLVDYDPS